MNHKETLGRKTQTERQRHKGRSVECHRERVHQRCTIFSPLAAISLASHLAECRVSSPITETVESTFLPLISELFLLLLLTKMSLGEEYTKPQNILNVRECIVCMNKNASCLCSEMCQHAINNST